MSNKQNLIPFQDLELTNYAKQEEETFSALQWSEESLPLWKFVDKYTLPQIVRIEDGYYSQEEESSLSSGQILKIHCLKICKKVIGIDEEGNDVYIPLNTDKKVLLRAKNWFQTYDTVDDLAQARPIPRYVEATGGYYDATAMTEVEKDCTVEPGERLEVLRDTEKMQLTKKKSMNFKNMYGQIVKLPYNCAARFAPLLEMEELVFAEALQDHKLPLHVSFSTVSGEASNGGLGKSLSRYGVIELKNTFEEELIVASCGHENVRVIFTIPKQIDVTVKVALGTLTKDPVYSGLCHDYNNYRKIETLAIKRHEKDIYRTSGEVRGYEYILESAEGGQFEGLEKEFMNDVWNNPTSDDGYVEKETDKTIEKDVATGRKALPYEVTDINVNDFKEGGKYSKHVKNEGSDKKVESSNLKISSRKTSNTPSNSVTLVGIKKLDEEPQNEEITGNLKLSGPPINGNECETFVIDQENDYLVAIQQEYPARVSESIQQDSSGKSTATNQSTMETSQYKQSDIEVNNSKGDHSVSCFPNSIQSLSTEEICKCLQKLNLHRLEDIFRMNQINGELLVSLDLEDLRDLSLTSFEAKKLVKFVNGWRPD